jgi:type I restriction enzyme S subunit
LAKHLIPKPPLDEQKVVSKKFTVIDKQIKTEQDYLHKLQQMKQGLMSDLLSGKKRVRVEEELVVKDLQSE